MSRARLSPNTTACGRTLATLLEAPVSSSGVAAAWPPIDGGPPFLDPSFRFTMFYNGDDEGNTWIKTELDRRRLWVTAYANNAPCYIPSERILKEGGYEGGAAMMYYLQPAPFKPGLEDKIIGAVKEQIGKEFPAKFDPKKVIETQLNNKLPDGLNVKVVQETGDTIYLRLPHRISEGAELSDTDLEQVAGGKIADSNSTSYSCNEAEGGFNTRNEFAEDTTVRA